MLAYTVVQRFKVAFNQEIWLAIRETGRFVLYPGELACLLVVELYSIAEGNNFH